MPSPEAVPEEAVEAGKLHGTQWPEGVWLTMREHPHAPTDFYIGKGNLPCRRYGPIDDIRKQERERVFELLLREETALSGAVGLLRPYGSLDPKTVMAAKACIETAVNRVRAALEDPDD